jgi:hypothetical protein
MTEPDWTEPGDAQPLETGPALVPGRSEGTATAARRLAVVASLAAAAVIAVLLGGVVAFQSSANVLSPSEVAQRLAAEAPASPGDSPSPGAAPSAGASADPSSEASPQTPSLAPGDGAPSIMDTIAATLTITCDGSRIAHATWSIKPSYRLSGHSQTATVLTLSIESDVHDDVTLKVTCPALVQTVAPPDDHGGGGDGGGGESGGGDSGHGGGPGGGHGRG